jgi:hypothetical protein
MRQLDCHACSLEVHETDGKSCGQEVRAVLFQQKGSHVVRKSGSNEVMLYGSQPLGN